MGTCRRCGVRVRRNGNHMRGPHNSYLHKVCPRDLLTRARIARLRRALPEIIKAGKMTSKRLSALADSFRVTRDTIMRLWGRKPA